MNSNGVLLLWLAFVAAYDFRKRRVPNWLVVSGSVFALASLAIDMQPFGLRWPQALLGAAAGFGFLLLFYIARLMGAGDVKFAGALGLWTGLQPLFPIWVIASLLAGVHGALWLILRRWPWFPRLALALSGKPHAGESGESPRKGGRHIPYAAYLALAAAGWMVWGR